MDDQTAASPQLQSTDSATQALVENADRLGLTWQLRPATVKDTSPVINVQVDGDTVPLTATTLVGGVAPGARVYVIMVPPSGLFIVGNADPVGFMSRKVVSGSSQASVVFSGLPTNLFEIEVSYRARCDGTGTTQTLRMTLNGSSSSSYTTENTQGNGATTTSATLDSGATTAFVGLIPAASAGGNISGTGKVWLPGVDLTSLYPSWIYHNAVMATALSNVGGGVYAVVGAINSVKFAPASGNFISGTEFLLKGTFA